MQNIVIGIQPAIVAAPAAPPAGTWRDTLSIVVEKIWELAVTLFKAITVGLLLFVNPTIFAISFCYGAIWDEKAEEIVGKIEHLVKCQGIFSGFCLVAGSFINLPVTLAVVTVYGGLRMGLFMNEGV